MLKKTLLILLACVSSYGCTHSVKSTNTGRIETCTNSEMPNHSEKFIEYELRLENGNTISIAQKQNSNLRVGQRVRIINNKIIPMQ